MPRRRKLPALPSHADIHSFLEMADSPPSRKELYKIFGITKRQQPHFDALIEDLFNNNNTPTQNTHDTPSLPPVSTAIIASIRNDGIYAEPSPWKHHSPPPQIRMKGNIAASLQLKERVLLKIFKEKGGKYTGKLMKRLPNQTSHRPIILVAVEQYGRLVLHSTDKKAMRVFIPAGTLAKSLKKRDLVLASPIPGSKQRQAGLIAQLAEVSEIFGSLNDPGGMSALAIAEHELPLQFPEAALQEAKKHKDPRHTADRVDLRDIPLVTIDGADARDFDDAVWAKPLKNHPKGACFELIVAIADVAHYVPEDSALDKEARLRGNSTYFPDRVVPMLPEALSNGLCSLNPNVDRYCMATRLWIDQQGNTVDSEIIRGIMRSAARLTYEQVQEARDTQNKQETIPTRIYTEVLKALYSVYDVLKSHREQRGSLELDLPEFDIVLDETRTKVQKIVKVKRLDSHCLIEECMIAANVAVAKLLSLKEHPGIFRAHEPPSPERIDDLREFLKDFGHHLPKGDGIGGKQFNTILNRAKGQPESEIVSTAILRSQSQANYEDRNVGHFGLALHHYCHFTSPIRRYADLIIHRSLIRLLKLGKDGLSDPHIHDLETIASHISKTERASALAERDTRDRFAALYYRRAISKTFEASVSGEAGIGIFVTLLESGASGLIPQRTRYSRHRQKRKSGTLHFGDPITVRLTETDPLTGRMRFERVKTKSADKVKTEAKKQPVKKKPRRKPRKKKGEG